MRAVEERFGEDLAVLLHRLRFQDGLTTKEIAGRIEVPKVTVDHWLQQLELTFVAMARKSA
jgi:DNA-binding transcriptional regulator LsrR (DeoR family)